MISKLKFQHGDDNYISNIQNRLNRLSVEPCTIAVFFGALSFILRIPLLFRWDLNYNGDTAVCYLTTLHISHGDHPFYLYGQDYQGTPPFYLAAWLFKLFGPSIPIASTVSLFEWSLASALGVYLLIRGTSKFVGIIGGMVIAVGVPYTLHHNVEPFMGYPLAVLCAMLVLLETCFLIEKGPTLKRTFLMGLTLGASMYLGKQFIPAVPGCILALALFSGWDLKKLPILKLASGIGLGYFLGYSPELYYRWNHPVYLKFSSIASPYILMGNFHNLFKSIPAYFDAQFYSRTPCTGYFTSYYYTYPRSFMDIFFTVVAGCVLVLIVSTFFSALKRKNTPLFLMASLILFNLFAVLVAAASHGDFWEPRRYLYASSIAFSVFLGMFYASLIQDKSKWISLAGVFIMTLFLGRVFLHEIDLLEMPELHMVTQLKQAIHVMDEWGINRGIAEWGQAYMIAGLTDERIIMGNGTNSIPGYDDQISSSKYICVLQNDVDKVKENFIYHGNNFVVSGKTRYLDGYEITPYMMANHS